MLAIGLLQLFFIMLMYVCCIPDLSQDFDPEGMLDLGKGFLNIEWGNHVCSCSFKFFLSRLLSYLGFPLLWRDTMTNATLIKEHI